MHWVHACAVLPPLLLTVTPGATPGIEGLEWERRSSLREQVLWVICSHWQIYLFCVRVCHQGPGRNSFPNALWHVLVSSVLGNDAAFWRDWDCKCEYVCCLKHLLGEAFIIIEILLSWLTLNSNFICWNTTRKLYNSQWMIVKLLKKSSIVWIFFTMGAWNFFSFHFFFL